MKFIVLLSVLLLASISLAKQETIDYVVATKYLTGNTGYVSLSPMTYGQAEYLTIAFEFAMDSSTTNCILSLGTGNDLLEVTVINGFLVIRDSKFEAKTSITFTTNQYYHVVIQLRNVGGSSIMNFFLNGVDKTSTLSRTSFAPFTNSQRQSNYIALCPSRSNPKNGHVYFNEFKIYGRKLTSTEITNSANPQIRLPPSLLDLVVYYPFNEGTGDKSFGVAGTFAQESFTAQFSIYALFTTRLEQGVLSCESTGDPHITTFTGHYWTPTHKTAYSMFVSCKVNNKKGYFSVKSFHDFGHKDHPKATLNRGFKVTYDKTVLKVDVGFNIYKNEGNSQGKFTKISNVNQEIGPLSLVFNEAKDTLQIFGSPFGYLKIINYGSTYMNIWTKISSTMCNVRDESYCDGSTNFIDEIEYDDDVPVPISPPLMDPPHQEYNPCSEDPDLASLANRVCLSKFPDVNSAKHKDCVFDICATGDPTVPVVIDEDCIAKKRLLILQGKTAEADQLQCQDCNCLYGDCDPITKTCTCFEGYVGPDCSQEKHLLNLTVDHSMTFNNRAVHLSSHFINLPESAATALSAASLNSWTVEDSALIYVASTRRLDGENQEVKYEYQIFVVGDVSSQNADATVNIPYTITSTATPTFELLRPSGSSISSSSANLLLSPFYTNGFVIRTLGSEWCVNFDLSGKEMFKQVVVGSGNKLGKLDVLKIQKSALSSVKVCGKELINPCAEYTSCTDCMVDERCGWCRSNQRCLFGNPAGPVEGTSCARWAYTFEDTVSRRVNAEFGVPVNPKKQDVFLVSGSNDLATLPVEITVDMGQSKGSIFDLAIITPEIGLHFGMFRDNLYSVLEKLQPYPSLGISFSTYTANGISQKTLLESFNRTSETLAGILQGLQPGQNPDDRPDKALVQISTTSNPRWRVNARHVALVIVSNTAATVSVSEIATTRNALLGQAVFPIFAVRSSKVAEYQSFVDQLGFGAVVILSETGENLADILSDAVDIATKSVALVPNVPGHIIVGSNSEVWNIFGLQSNMRGRMQFPMNKGSSTENLVSQLVAPGYGTASIESLRTDKPTGTGVHVDMIQEQPLQEQPLLHGQIIELSGRALNPSDPVFIHITSFGAPLNPSVGLGKFYQLPDNIADITSYDDLVEIVAPSFVENGAGKIIYAPPPGAFSVSASLGKQSYTSITYEVYDACTKSDPHTIDVSISYENKPPTNLFITPTSVENRVTLITFGGVDERLHSLKAVVDKAPSQTVDGVFSYVGGLYQYDEAAFNLLNSAYDIYRELDVPSILSGLSRIDTTSGSVEVTDTLMRAMFIPDRYTNSEHKPASDYYQRDPSVVYHVVQIKNEHDGEMDIPLFSSSTAHGYSIKWVNQPPSVTEFTSDVHETHCTYLEDCHFYQNLGTYYPNTPSPVFLNAIVTDIEQEPLFVRVTSVSCPSGAYLVDANGAAVVAGSDIDGFSDNLWSVAFQFKPERDAYGNDTYCTITYKGYDGYNVSFDEATIDIFIDYLDQPPIGEGVHPILYLNTTSYFNVTFHDMDSSVVSGKVVRCELSPQNFDFTLKINGVDIDCSALPNNIGDDLSLSLGFVDESYYSGNVPAEATCLNCRDLTEGIVASVFLEFEDDFSEHRVNYTKPQFIVELYYMKINTPPVLYRTGDEINNSTNYFMAISQKVPTQGGNVDPYVGANITAYDVDINNLYYAKVTFEVTPAIQGGLFMYNPLGSLMADYVDFVADVTPWGTTFEGTLENINFILSGYKVSSTIEGIYNVTFTFDDYGNSGACEIGISNPCSKYATAVLQFTATDTNRIGGVIAGATAAGAVVLGGAALALAWMKFKNLRAPAEGPNPWLLDENGDEVIENPMYIQRGGEAENPIYETASVNDG